jgi:hypothetical protein
MRYEHGMAMLLRSAFRDTGSRTGALQRKAIGIARSIDQELQKQQGLLVKSLHAYSDTENAKSGSGSHMKPPQLFRARFDRRLHLKCLLLSQQLTYIGTWLQSALVKINIEIAKLSMKWADFAAEPADVYGQGFIDTMQPLVAMLDQLEESMSSLEYVSMYILLCK